VWPRGDACRSQRLSRTEVRVAGATIREGLLAAVVDHLLELDVEIRWQDISERPGACRSAFQTLVLEAEPPAALPQHLRSS
jgi:hypothetical protein